MQQDFSAEEAPPIVAIFAPRPITRHQQTVQFDLTYTVTNGKQVQGLSNFVNRVGKSRKTVVFKSWGKWRCANCGTPFTPERRKGPLGSNSLCNKCGIRWAKEENMKKRAPPEVLLERGISPPKDSLPDEEVQRERESTRQKMAVEALLS